MIIILHDINMKLLYYLVLVDGGCIGDVFSPFGMILGSTRTNKLFLFRSLNHPEPHEAGCPTKRITKAFKSLTNTFRHI